MALFVKADAAQLSDRKIAELLQCRELAVARWRRGTTVPRSPVMVDRIKLLIEQLDTPPQSQQEPQQPKELYLRHLNQVYNRYLNQQPGWSLSKKLDAMPTTWAGIPFVKESTSDDDSDARALHHLANQLKFDEWFPVFRALNRPTRKAS